ncbi:NADH-ubiquinone oxidoreductase subunit b14.5b (NDUFC2) domain-containing protein [Phthorimaea operculella]|nr:NADH-ubiquinone oxidoreductase subunit b14.5b (NDUFC2) domain-containing protein [Phthorimaea operculella]KAI5633236.1 NADH-ubiquinone oxidoreductase subunit b14.5b (NDUFC2) domain-containing protein [Phthorimaea operculella]
MSSAHLSAKELLKLGDEDRVKPKLNQYWPHILGVAFGIGTGVMINFGTRRPVFSGIQKHIAATAGWTVALNYAQKKRDDYYAEKDAVFRHYIELHPEDFPEPERKKIGELFEPWIPIR